MSEQSQGTSHAVIKTLTRYYGRAKMFERRLCQENRSEKSIRWAINELLGNEPDSLSFRKTIEYLNDPPYIMEPFDSILLPVHFHRPAIDFVSLKKCLDIDELKPIAQERPYPVLLLTDEVRIRHVTSRIWVGSIFLLATLRTKSPISQWISLSGWKMIYRLCDESRSEHK